MILDTNALSAAAETEPSALQAIAQAESIAVPVVVLGEFRMGISQSRHRATYAAWLDEWVEATTVLNIDEETAKHYAAIGIELKRNGTPIPTNDLWIAALCRQHSLAILSRDRHFDLVPGVRRLGW